MKKNKIKKKLVTIKTVGIKSGCFSLIHYGHIWMLEQCKLKCDYLIVLTNNDNYIKSKKGVVPIPLLQRKKILSSLYLVDEVYSFDEDTEDKWIKYFKEHHMSKRFPGAKLIIFHSDEIKNNKFVPGEEYADKIIYIKRIPNNSVTDIFKKIKGYK